MSGARVAVFSATLALVETIIFRSVYPVLPPIVIVPFATCLFFGMASVFTRKQWIIGLVSFILTVTLTGSFLPGQLMIPIYGLLFQKACGRHSLVGVAGFVGSLLHVLYGTLLAPLIFSVAPARQIVTWLTPYVGQLALAIVIVSATFGVLGVVGAEIGYRIGSTVHMKTDPGLMRVDDRRVKEEMVQ